LIFLDDDIEASPSLVEAHVNAHSNQTNRVVIGYLPPIIYCDNEFFSPAVREWWENAFDAMRHKSHRFHYRNLTSGNFSIFHQFFAEVGGFNIGYVCQEDYELGLRLLQKGAAFQFSEDAMGYHHDMTNIEKLAGRRCCEAQAAVMFAKQYPELLPGLPYLQRLQANVGRVIDFC
jgi:GT2 family glycosyltransferase